MSEITQELLNRKDYAAQLIEAIKTFAGNLNHVSDYERNTKYQNFLEQNILPYLIQSIEALDILQALEESKQITLIPQKQEVQEEPKVEIEQEKKSPTKKATKQNLNNL
jgi:hypothetical protein